MSFLCRARLRRDGSAAALLPLLMPNDSSNSHGGHALMWSLFADSPDRRRDFLWREMSDGTFYILSERMPHDRHALFDIDPPKPFEPTLRSGQALRFLLRANAVVRVDGHKHDIVMHALRGLQGEARRIERERKTRETGLAWLRRQGERNGFVLAGRDNEPATNGEAAVSIDGYRSWRVMRRAGNKRGADMTYSTLDFSGRLIVTDPDLFVSAVKTGFGASKAFGCGLMLIRPA